MPPDTDMHITYKKGYLWITLPPEITRTNNPQIYNKIEAILLDNTAPVALDMSRTEFIYTMTIGLILDIRQRMLDSGNAFCLVNVTDKLRTQFEHVHLDKVLSIYRHENDMTADN
jgi:anti-anti-sigma factor